MVRLLVVVAVPAPGRAGALQVRRVAVDELRALERIPRHEAVRAPVDELHAIPALEPRQRPRIAVDADVAQRRGLAPHDGAPAEMRLDVGGVRRHHRNEGLTQPRCRLRPGIAHSRSPTAWTGAAPWRHDAMTSRTKRHTAGNVPWLRRAPACRLSVLHNVSKQGGEQLLLELFQCQAFAFDSLPEFRFVTRTDTNRIQHDLHVFVIRVVHFGARQRWYGRDVRVPAGYAFPGGAVSGQVRSRGNRRPSP